MRAQSPSMNKSSVRCSYCSYDCYLCRLTVRFCPSSLAFCPFICLLLLHVISLFFFLQCKDRLLLKNNNIKSYFKSLQKHFHIYYLNSQNSFSLLSWHSGFESSISADQTNSRCLESQVFLLRCPVLLGKMLQAPGLSVTALLTWVSSVLGRHNVCPTAPCAERDFEGWQWFSFCTSTQVQKV